MILLHHVLEKQWHQIHPKRNLVKFSAEENMWQNHYHNENHPTYSKTMKKKNTKNIWIESWIQWEEAQNKLKINMKCTATNHVKFELNSIKDYLVQCQMKRTKPNKNEIMALYNTVYIVKNNRHCHFKFQKHVSFLNV